MRENNFVTFVPSMVAQKTLPEQGFRVPRFLKDGDAKEATVLRDLKSRSRRTGAFFARNDDLLEKETLRLFLLPTAPIR